MRVSKKGVFMEVVTFQDLQGSVVDPGRILQHQGRHPERDDGSAQVPGRGMHCDSTTLTWDSHKLSNKRLCPIWTDSHCRK